jgi:hypothetical protein
LIIISIVQTYIKINRKGSRVNKNKDKESESVKKRLFSLTHPLPHPPPILSFSEQNSDPQKVYGPFVDLPNVD